MNKPLVALVALYAAVAAAPSIAADPKAGAAADHKAGAASDILSWFQRLEAGLSSSLLGSDRQAGDNAAAVAAVRAAPQSASNAETPAWIGGIRYERLAVLKKERKELANAVDLIVKGRFAEGSKALIAFETAHPKSALLKDAMEAQRKLKALEKPAPKKDAPSAATSAPAAPKSQH
jgi:hypothetical protein